MSAIPSAFYLPEGDHLTPTALCIGPWSADLQHGGPPSALLLRAILAEVPPSLNLGRLTVDLVRPVPMLPIRAEARIIRQGRLVTWAEASLTDTRDRLLARAHAVLHRATSIDLPPSSTPVEPEPPAAAAVAPFEFPFFPAEIAYHKGIEARIVAGTWPVEPCTAWMRLTRPLVDGEQTDPRLALVTLADACNGLSPAVIDLGMSFVNGDLSVYLRRPPVGEAFAFAARSLADASGMGLGQATIYDEGGELGRSIQSLVIDRRGS